MTEYRGGPVEVRIPDKLKVETPGTDKRIDALSKVFQAFSKMLRESVRKMVDSLEVLKELPALLRDFQGMVAQQFTNLFTHQMEAQVHTRQANLLAASKKREVINSLYEEKVDQLPVDRERITRRYRQLLEKVGELVQSQIQKLDSHAFRLVDKAYPEHIQRRFTFESAPTYEYLAAYAEESAVARTIPLESALQNARRGIRDLLEKRRVF